MPGVTSGDGTGSLQSDLDQLTSAPLLGATGSGKHGRCATNCLRLAVGGGLFSCVAAVLMCTGLLWSVRGEVKRLGGVPYDSGANPSPSHIPPGPTAPTVHCTIRGDDPCFGVSVPPSPASSGSSSTGTEPQQDELGPEQILALSGVYPEPEPDPGTCNSTDYSCPPGRFCAGFEHPSTGVDIYECVSCDLGNAPSRDLPNFRPAREGSVDFCDPTFFKACPHVDPSGQLYRLVSCKPCKQHSDCPTFHKFPPQSVKLPDGSSTGPFQYTQQSEYCRKDPSSNTSTCTLCLGYPNGDLPASKPMDPGRHPGSNNLPSLRDCDGVHEDCCSASFQHQCPHDPWQCKACTKHSDCPGQGAACGGHLDTNGNCKDVHSPEFCTDAGQCRSCSNITAINTTSCPAFDKNCCSKDFISTCPTDPHNCGPREIAGSFEWKLTWAAAAGCKDVGSVAYVGGTDSTQGVRTMLQVCPAALLHGAPPLIDSAAGPLTEARRAGECHIPQTPYLGTGENGGSCHTAE